MLGKTIIGIAGYVYGDFFGLLVGLYVGHQVDRRLLPKLFKKVLLKHQIKIQKAFFEATFSVMGHLAKVDGHVSEEEIRLARQVMQRMKLDENATHEAMALFTQGKADDFDLDAALQSLYLVARRHRSLLQMFIEMQLTTAYADGELSAAEREVLLNICTTLGFSEADFERLDGMVKAEIHNHRPGRTKGMSLEDAFAILNIEEAATNAEVKRSYRRLTSQHHPDKLEAKGLPKEMMKLAEEKTHEIRTAYERIREERGFK